MKKDYSLFLLRTVYLLVIISFLTGLPFFEYSSTCQSGYSYLNPFGIEKNFTNPFSNLCGMMLTNGPFFLHFLLTDLTVFWILLLISYFYFKKKKFLLKKIALFSFLFFILIVIFNFFKIFFGLW